MSAIEEYEKAMRGFNVPQVPLEVYDSCSWRRVGLKGDYKELMYPVIAKDGHPDIAGHDLLRALVAAFNAMLEQRNALQQTSGHNVAPIAKVTVWVHLPPSVELYAPGLPPGEHDLFPVPLATPGELRNV